MLPTQPKPFSQLSRTFFSIAALTLVGVVLAGCGDSSSTSESDSQVSLDGPVITAPVSMINGVVPPGKLDPLYDVTTMLDTIDAQGNRIFVSRGTRMPGTRVAIHVHEYGGHTCVVSGTITDFVEGKESSTFPAGTCYYMPPNTPMTAANLGSEPAVLIDNFTLPSDAPMITILEPGWDEVIAESSK
jgi:quercetin dioxygenase-like cupin family protein